MIFRFFKKSTPVKLGRWKTLKSKDVTARMVDLANCDSCGVCNNERKKIKKEEIYLLLQDDIINYKFSTE